MLPIWAIMVMATLGFMVLALTAFIILLLYVLTSVSNTIEETLRRQYE